MGRLFKKKGRCRIMWFDNIKKKKVNKLQMMATAAEAYGGEIFWLNEGLDIVFINKQDRDSWSADFVFQIPIKFRQEMDPVTNEPRYWAFIEREMTDSSSRVPPPDRETPSVEIDDEEQGTNYREYLRRPNWQRKNM